MATVNGRRMMSDLFIAFACIGCPQFVKAFEAVLMEDVPCRTRGSSLDIEVVFVRCKNVAATVGSDMVGEYWCTLDMIVHRDLAWC